MFWLFFNRQRTYKNSDLFSSFSLRARWATSRPATNDVSSPEFVGAASMVRTVFMLLVVVVSREMNAAREIGMVVFRFRLPLEVKVRSMVELMNVTSST